MKKILFPLLLATVALLSCQKEPDKVETDPAVLTPDPGTVEPATLFVEGLASADASDPSTRSWIYTNDASGAEVLKFCWSDNAYATDGTARFEGYWADDNGCFDSVSGNLHTILNSSQHATYVATVDGDTNIHVALPSAAWNASDLIVLYSGNNVNHTYWFENPEHAEVSVEKRSKITFTFNGLNKRSFYAPNMDNNEAIYGAATLSSDVLTQEGDLPVASVNFNFKHLESVFRVRIKNEYSSSINLDRIIIQAKPRKNNPGTKPFANKLCLTYKYGEFTRSLFEDPDVPGECFDSDWFATEPVLTIPETDNDPYEHMSIPSGGVETVYLMPLANPDCNLNNWVFTFTVEAWVGGKIEKNSVYVNGSAIASGTGKRALQPGYVYTIGLKAAPPGMCEFLVDEQMMRFQRSGHDLTLYPPMNASYSGDILIPSEITDNGETFYIRKIEEYAFMGQTELTSVVFPDYVEFEDTEALFYGCTSLTSVTFPAEGLTTIGENMFALCSLLESLTIPASVTSIEPQAFLGCSQLGGHIVSQSSSIIVNESGLVYTPSGELFWAPENLSGAVSIPDGITRIMSSAVFAPPVAYGFPPSQISELGIPAIVTQIDDNNFMFLQNLQKLTVNWMEQDSMPVWYGSNGQKVGNENVISSGQWFAGMDLSTIELSVPVAYEYLYRSTEPWQSFNVTTRE